MSHLVNWEYIFHPAFRRLPPEYPGGSRRWGGEAATPSCGVSPALSPPGSGQLRRLANPHLGGGPGRRFNGSGTGRGPGVRPVIIAGSSRRRPGINSPADNLSPPGRGGQPAVAPRAGFRPWLVGGQGLGRLDAALGEPAQPAFPVGAVRQPVVFPLALQDGVAQRRRPYWARRSAART